MKSPQENFLLIQNKTIQGLKTRLFHLVTVNVTKWTF